jgi:hypothetical protein
MPRASFGEVMKDREKLLATVAANKDDLQHLESYRTQLEVEVAGAKSASIRQSTLQAEVQQTTRDLEGFLSRGADLENRLRTGIRSRYGNRSEKLTEFGMRPLRKRKTSLKEKAPQVTKEKPAPQGITTTDVEVESP